MPNARAASLISQSGAKLATLIPSGNRQLIYSWEADRWSSAEMSLDRMFNTIKAGLPLEQVSAIYPNLATMPFSLASPTFMAQALCAT